MREGTLERPYFPWIVPFLLLLVREQGSHGQDLTRSVAEFGLGTTRPRTVYWTLRQMEQDGKVLSEYDESDCRLSRRGYSITELGEACLESYASSLVDYRGSMDLFLDTYAGGAVPTVQG